MACLECRRRRIKCDGLRPTCNQCGRLNKSCEYAVSDARRGPKPRAKFSRDLQRRLEAIEAQLEVLHASNPGMDDLSLGAVNFPSTVDAIPPPLGDVDLKDTENASDGVVSDDLLIKTPSSTDMTPPMQLADLTTLDSFPSVQEIQDLTSVFFDVSYPLVPFIHPKYHDPTAIFPKELQPPLALKYAMWMIAALHSDHLTHKAHEFYQSARMHLQHDEMEGDGVSHVTFHYAQAWALVGQYEVLTAIPTRAFMSSHKAITLSQMLELHRLDEAAIKGQTCHISVVDSIQLEEKRRTFWWLFIADKWINSGRGLTSSRIPYNDIMTYVPKSEDGFLNDRSEKRYSFSDVTTATPNNSAPLLIAVFVACLNAECTRLLTEVAKIETAEDEQAYWTKHNALDQKLQKSIQDVPNTLSTTSQKDPTAIFASMCFHEFTCSIFMAATKIARTSLVQKDLVGYCRQRARTAAEEIVNLMRLQLDVELKRMSCYTPSALYMASTVFVNDLARGYETESAIEAILFLLFAIKMFRNAWKISQVFLARLLNDLKVIGIEPEMEQDDLEELNCWKGWQGIKTDIDALGPLFARRWF